MARPFASAHRLDVFEQEIAQFDAFQSVTQSTERIYQITPTHKQRVPYYTNEFWTSRQRQANPLHEISYRACFKPQLPGFFIERLTLAGEVVLDPFMGRGTTPLEAALRDRIPYGSDVNPLSRYLLWPRLRPPQFDQVRHRLDSILWRHHGAIPEELLVFYHPETLRHICALKTYLEGRDQEGKLDEVDDWIRMVALNRLTGHSSGFFSVYSMPPNQAVSVASQRRINARRQQVPPARDVPGILLRKTKSLLRQSGIEGSARLKKLAAQARLMVARADHIPEVQDESVSLVVTSPPFLDVVDYAADNWLRCWFLGIQSEQLAITRPHRLEAWRQQMTSVLSELRRVMKAGGVVAMEVGEVRKGRVDLEETVIASAIESGLHVRMVMVQQQSFTKTARCWGVTNNRGGTNTQRIVLLSK
ncbi:MAG: DNA methyltransferase [Limisphaerales bacterium]